MSQKNKANLTSSLNIAITDALNKQNTSVQVRNILQDIIDSSVNIYESGSTINYFTSGSTGNYSLKTLNDTSIDALGNYAFAEGDRNLAIGNYSHAEGRISIASGDTSHSEGLLTTANGDNSHAEGRTTTANGYSSHSEGYYTQALGSKSHSEGSNTTAYGDISHAEGDYTLANGYASHAEGEGTTALGDYSHAEGNGTTAIGSISHAEGNNTKSIGFYSHSEGSGTVASGYTSHAEGRDTIASGDASHSEGYLTEAIGNGSHAGGGNSDLGFKGGIASGSSSFVHGINSIAGGATTIVLGDNITGLTDNTVYVPDVVIDSSKVIKSAYLGGELNLNAYNQGAVMLSNDNSGYGAGVLYLDSTNAYGELGLYTTDSIMTLHNDKAIIALLGNNSSLSTNGILISTSANPLFTPNASAFPTSIGSQNSVVFNGSINSVLIGGSENTLNGDVSNSIILGGSGLTASANNTVYVPYLNIKNFTGNTAVAGLAIDAFGNVVTGNTSSSFTGGTVTGATNFTGTLSATTYLGLPIDITVTGGTYSSGTATYTNNTGGTFSVTGFSTSKRILVVAQSATPSTNINNGDIMQITGLAQAITSMSTNLTGTPYDGQMIMWQITDNGTGRAITWGTSFTSSSATLPLTTTASIMLRVLTQYNAVTSKHECIA